MELSERLARKRIVLAANIVDGYPSEFEYSTDFLLRNGIEDLLTISSPLEKRSRARTVLTRFNKGKVEQRTVIPRPNFPPYSHVLDLMLPLRRIKYDLWIGFNPVMTAVGALSARHGVLANWAIDFVPRRSNQGVAEGAYRALERYMMRRLDIQIENTEAAMAARATATCSKPKLELLAPIGVWKSGFCEPTMVRHSMRTVVYFGSLDQRNGAPFLAEIIQYLLQTDPHVRVEVIGDGPGAHHLQSIGTSYQDRLHLHGYMEQQADVDAILRRSTVALAPYDESPGLFTRFADPQKLKYYAASSVPVLLTDVAPAARLMERAGAAKVLSAADHPSLWVQSIRRFLDSPEAWMNSARAAHHYALSFERDHIYTRTFEAIVDYMDKPRT